MWQLTTTELHSVNTTTNNNHVPQPPFDAPSQHCRCQLQQQPGHATSQTDNRWQRQPGMLTTCQVILMVMTHVPVTVHQGEWLPSSPLPFFTHGVAMSQHVNQQWLNDNHMTTNDSQHPGEQHVSLPLSCFNMRSRGYIAVSDMATNSRQTTTDGVCWRRPGASMDIPCRPDGDDACHHCQHQCNYRL